MNYELPLFRSLYQKKSSGILLQQQQLLPQLVTKMSVTTHKLRPLVGREDTATYCEKLQKTF